MSDKEEFSNQGPVRKRGSLVWQFFEKLSSIRVKCRICQHEQRYMGNTANALRHLKVKHDIDVRPIGLSDPENVKRMKALTPFGFPFESRMSAIRIKNESNFFNEDYHRNMYKQNNSQENFKKSRQAHRSINHHDDENDIDPYGNNEEPLVDFISTDNHYNNNGDVNEVLNPYHNSKKDLNCKRSFLEDERIRAEIEYFREKAAYFRIQKHLTALQAKKVKFELEQLYAKQTAI